MKNKDTSYYVPEQSAWPIIGALALLFLAFGSLNVEKKWGLIALTIGVVGLVFMLTGWFRDVTREREAGLYPRQIDRTFRWGMVWFLIAELFLFGLLIGSIIHVRFSITPWLAGQRGDASQLTHYLLWPDFTKHWPLVNLPSTAATGVSLLNSISLHIPLINLILLLFSAILLTNARYHFKKIHYKLCRLNVNLAVLLAFIFLVTQIYYLIHIITIHIISRTGIYGSFLIAFIGFHLMNSAIALLFLFILCFRIYHKKSFKENTFFFDACVWWWNFLTIIWILGFSLIV